MNPAVEPTTSAPSVIDSTVRATQAAADLVAQHGVTGLLLVFLAVILAVGLVVLAAVWWQLTKAQKARFEDLRAHHEAVVTLVKDGVDAHRDTADTLELVAHGVERLETKVDALTTRRGSDAGTPS